MGSWQQTQRKGYHKKSVWMTAERITSLEATEGWIWEEKIHGNQVGFTGFLNTRSWVDDRLIHLRIKKKKSSVMARYSTSKL